MNCNTTHYRANSSSVPGDPNQPIILLSTAGLLYVMFIAGLEIDLAIFRRHRNQSLVFGVLCFLIPGALGVATGLLLGYSWTAALLLGAVISPHTLLTYPMVSRLGLSKRMAVTTAVGGTILTDVLALMVLTVVAGATAGTLDAWFWIRTIGSLVVFGGMVIWGVPRLGNWFFKHTSFTKDQEFAFVLMVLFGAGALAKLLDIEPIVGAFLAGLTLNQLIPERSPLMNRVQFVGNAVFIPFFLLATGMLVNPQVLVGSTRSWVIAGAIVATAVIGKWLANWLTGMIYGYSKTDRWTMYGLTVSHAAATLAVALTGMRLGLFGEDAINGIVVMMFTTCLLAAFVVQRYGTRLAIEEAAKPVSLHEVPQRILLPIVKPENTERLMDLAMLVRDPASHEPIVPLTVVRPANQDVATEVARAERLLARAVIHAGSADVPVQPVVRVSFNVAAGIKQAAIDTRTTMLIMAWNGERSLTELAFGAVIDRVLSQSTTMALLARLTGPINTTKRVIAIQPPLIQGHPGFRKVKHTLKHLAARLDAELVIWEVEGVASPSADLSPYRPEGAPETQAVASWKALNRKISTEIERDDLVIVLCAREEHYALPQAILKLPRLLSQRTESNFLVLYAPELELPAEQVEFEPVAMQPRHAVFPLQALTTDAALQELMEHSVERFSADSADEDRFVPEPSWLEVIPGAQIAGVRLQNWPEMTVAVGVCRKGIPHPGSIRPIQVILLCLLPAEMPLAEETAYLQWVGRQVSQPEILQYLGQFPQTETLAEIFSMA